MTTRRAGKGTANRDRMYVAPQPAVQEALEVTWTLKGHLKNAQIAYIRVGSLLARVRDEKMYAVLGHADMEAYALQRLRMGRAALYRYLQVHDWIARYHKEWLVPRPTGFIPNLTDVTDLIWVEEELAKPGLDAKRRAVLEDLRKRGLDGTLREGEVDAFRRHGRGGDSLKSFLSGLRLLRRRGARLANMPAAAISDLDAAIDAVSKAVSAQ